MPASNIFKSVQQGLNFASQQELQKLQRQQQLMALDEQRKGALFQDARSVNSYLKAGQPQMALGVLSDRMGFIEQFGGDPRDTKEVADLIAQGDIKGATSLLDSVEQAGIGAGYLNPASTQEKEAFQKAEGGLVFNPNTGEYSVDETAVKRFAELNDKKNQQGTLDIKDRRAINTDITKFSKQADDIVTAAQDLSVLKKIGGGPSAIAAVFKFMKVLDPGSVVKEDEFATAENSAGVPQGIRNTFNKLLSGERLSDDQYNQFISTAQGLANNAVSSSQETINAYLETFEDTLPKRFIEKVKNRVPKKFDMEDSVKTVNWSDL